MNERMPGGKRGDGGELPEGSTNTDQNLCSTPDGYHWVDGRHNLLRRLQIIQSLHAVGLF